MGVRAIQARGYSRAFRVHVLDAGSFGLSGA
jgi:hypothetical protein